MLSGWILLTEFVVVLGWRPICSLDDVCSLFLACTPALLGWLCVAGVVFCFVLELLDVCTPVVFELLHLFQWIVGTVGVVYVVGVVVNTPGVLHCCYGSTVLLELAWIRV